jgi:hypothetical protein
LVAFGNGSKEATIMPHVWPSEPLIRLELNVVDRACSVCGRKMHVCDHRRHPIYTLEGPRLLINRLVHCPDVLCTGHRHTVSPEAEAAIALPQSIIGWDLFCWIGHRRFARHWSVPQIRGELRDTHQIGLSEDAIEDAVRDYQRMLAARQQDPQVLAADYAAVDQLRLTIDGLQPEKGHETLYVVRELTLKRVWFAEALVSSSADEVRRLIAEARIWAERLGKPVVAWVSDKQDAFLTGIAAEFPGVPHHYCQNHFLRDVAKPVLELDSHAKVQMRSKVRGLRAIEREALANGLAAPTANPVEVNLAEVTPAIPGEPVVVSQPPATNASAVVLDYCTAIKGILNDDQGGPLHPPGLRMASALEEVQQSLERNLQAKKGGALKTNCNVWLAASSVD